MYRYIVDFFFIIKIFRWCEFGCDKFVIYFKLMGLYFIGFF